MKGAGSLRGWLAAVLVLVAAAVCVRLGFWQLDRHAQRQSLNQELQAALLAPPLELDSRLATALAERPGELVYHTVRVRGEFLPESEVVWRGRSRDGTPGVHLLTPLRLEGTSDIVFVDRGWVPSPDAARIDPREFHERGAVDTEALIRLYPDGPLLDAAPTWMHSGGDSILTLRRLDPALLGARVGQPVLGFYLQQLPSEVQRTPPFRAAHPAPSQGPHLGYAVQWFGFAAVFIVGLTVIVVRRRS